MTSPGARFPALPAADALALVRAVVDAGAERGWAPLAAVIVDLTGEIQAAWRADGAAPFRTTIAVAKARTAVNTLMPSGDTAAIPEGITAAVRTAHHGDFVTRAGGLPVELDGVVVGGIGVSGAMSEEDESAAKVALERVLGRQG